MTKHLILKINGLKMSKYDDNYGGDYKLTNT